MIYDCDYDHVCIWAFDGGGGVDKGGFDAKSEFFWLFLDCLPEVRMVFVEKLVPTYFEYGEIKNQGPMSKRNSGGAVRSREVGWFWFSRKR